MHAPVLLVSRRRRPPRRARRPGPRHLAPERRVARALQDEARPHRPPAGRRGARGPARLRRARARRRGAPLDLHHRPRGGRSLPPQGGARPPLQGRVRPERGTRGAAVTEVGPLEALLIDLDGVLYVEDEPVEGAAEAVGRLRDAGLRLRFVTNTTARSRGQTL